MTILNLPRVSCISSLVLLLMLVAVESTRRRPSQLSQRIIDQIVNTPLRRNNPQFKHEFLGKRSLPFNSGQPTKQPHFADFAGAVGLSDPVYYSPTEESSGDNWDISGTGLNNLESTEGGESEFDYDKRKPSFGHSFVGKRELDFGHAFVGKRNPRFGHSFVGKRAPSFGHKFVGKRALDFGHAFVGKRGPSFGHSFVGKRAPSFGHSFIGKRAPKFGHAFVGKRAPSFGHSFIGKRGPVFGHSFVGKRQPSFGHAFVGKRDPAFGHAFVGKRGSSGDDAEDITVQDSGL